MTVEQVSVLRRMRLTDEEIDDLTQIAAQEIDNSHFGHILARAVINAYKYGVMQSKRIERARRKGKAAAEKGVQPCRA